MIDGYKIGVQFDLLDKLSPALATIQASIGRMLEQTKALQMALNGVATAQSRVAASAGSMGAISTNLNNATRSAQAYAGAMRNAAAASHAIPANSGLSALGNRGAIQGIQARYTGSPPPAPLVVPGLHDAMITAAVGGLVLHSLKAPIEEARKYQTVTEKFNQFGMGDKALAEAEKFAKTTKVFGTSNTEMLTYMQESQGIFRESGKHNLKEQLEGAKMTAPLMAKVHVASQGLDPHLKAMSDAKTMDMIRFAEMAGGLKSPEKMNSILSGGFKAIQSSGGNIDFTQMRQFMARSKGAATGIDEKTLFATMEPLIGENKGASAGVGYSTMMRRLNGMVNVKKNVAHDLVNSGIWDEKMINWNSKGGIDMFLGNPLKHKEDYEKGHGIEGYYKHISPIYKKLGLSQGEIQRWNENIGGSTGGALMTQAEMQRPTIEASKIAYDKARGLDPALKAVSKTLGGGEIAYAAAMKDFNLALGKSGGLLDLASKGLNKLTSAIESMTSFANRHPTLTKFAMYALAAVGALAVLGGGLLMMGMAFKSLGTVLKFALTLISRIGIIGPLLAGLGKYILTFGRFLVMTPIGMVLTAIAVAAYLLYTNWSTILPKIKAVWAIIKADFMFTFNSLKKSAKTIWTIIKSDFMFTWNAIKAGVSSIMTQIKDTIIGKLREAIAAISGLFSGIGGMVSGFGSRISNMFSMAKTASKQDVVRTGHEGGGIVIKNSFDMHGIATEVSKRQAKAMGAPRRGASGHDGSMGLKMVSQGAY